MANLKQNPLNYFLVPFFLFFQSIALYRQLKSRRYNLIHVHWLIPQGLVCAVVKIILGRNSPAMICTSHGGDLYALDNSFFNWFKKLVMNQSVSLCVVSNAMRRRVIKMGIPRYKIRVMPMGIDLVNLFRPVTEIIRKENRLIFVGRLVEKKGVSILLKAMVEVKSNIPDVELIIIGDGPLRNSLESLSYDLQLSDQVKFYGSIEHAKLPELYSSASVAVIPSIIADSGDQEGLGLVIIEAMGCGCAVIASSLEAIRDVIDVDTGIFVTPGDISELAKGICHLLQNPEKRTELAVQGRNKAVAEFDWQVAGARYLELIRETCSQG